MDLVIPAGHDGMTSTSTPTGATARRMSNAPPDAVQAPCPRRRRCSGSDVPARPVRVQQRHGARLEPAACSALPVAALPSEVAPWPGGEPRRAKRRPQTASKIGHRRAECASTRNGGHPRPTGTRGGIAPRPRARFPPPAGPVVVQRTRTGPPRHRRSCPAAGRVRPSPAVAREGSLAVLTRSRARWPVAGRPRPGHTIRAWPANRLPFPSSGRSSRRSQARNTTSLMQRQVSTPERPPSGDIGDRYCPRWRGPHHGSSGGSSASGRRGCFGGGVSPSSPSQRRPY